MPLLAKSAWSTYNSMINSLKDGVITSSIDNETMKLYYRQFEYAHSNAQQTIPAIRK